jgi:hypothetical protein
LVVATAWIWLGLGAGMEMSAIAMTRMAGTNSWVMQQAPWTPGYVMLMFFMWWGMQLPML